MQVQGAVRLAKKALRENRCVVIGLQSTGESRLMDVLEEKGEISEFVSSAKGVLVNLIQKHFPAPYSSDKKELKQKLTPTAADTGVCIEWDKCLVFGNNYISTNNFSNVFLRHCKVIYYIKNSPL